MFMDIHYTFPDAFLVSLFTVRTEQWHSFVLRDAAHWHTHIHICVLLLRGSSDVAHKITYISIETIEMHITNWKNERENIRLFEKYLSFCKEIIDRSIFFYYYKMDHS